MLFLFMGTDRKKVKSALAKAVEREARGARVVRITDANSVQDLRATFEGGGMFEEARVVVIEGVAEHPEMGSVLLDSLGRLRDSGEIFFVYEEKPGADVRRRLEKYAGQAARFDRPPAARDASVFALAGALRTKNKKDLWVGFRREITAGKAPEAIHGVLFWAAKEMLLKARALSAEEARASSLVAELATLPHEARRSGVEMEYALEAFLLSGR